MENKQFSSILNWLAVIVVVALGIFAAFNIGLSKPTSQHFANFGSYVGGVLGPLIAAVSIYFLIIQLKLLKQQLNDQTKQLDILTEQLNAQVISNKLDRLMRLEASTDEKINQLCNMTLTYMYDFKIKVTVGDLLGRGGLPENSEHQMSGWIDSLVKIQPELIYLLIFAAETLLQMKKECLPKDDAFAHYSSARYAALWTDFKAIVPADKIYKDLDEHFLKLLSQLQYQTQTKPD